MNVPGTKDISIPTEVTNENINKKLKEKIKHGSYLIGNLIVPQSFERVILRDNTIIVDEVVVHGRKIPMTEIRKKMFKDHNPYMRLRSDEDFEKLTREVLTDELHDLGEHEPIFTEYSTTMLKELRKILERTRHLMFWHDGSVLANHSHILMTVSAMYDPAVFITDQEYFKKHKKSLNVQAEVEKPYHYLLGWCPSNDQQILYIEKRIKDIYDMTEKIVSPIGIPYQDVMHLFKGDSLARQFEAGQRKGGNYVCTACSVHSNLISSLTHTFSLDHMSLQDRLNKIRISSQICQRLESKCLKLYENLKRHEIANELHQRNVKQYHKMTHDQFKKLLEKNVHGMQRLPALMYDHPTFNLSDLNLADYEILCHEPLHDISNHIKNLYNELVHHVPNNIQDSFKQIIQNSFNGKEAKNGSDYRKSLLLVGNWLLETAPEPFVT